MNIDFWNNYNNLPRWDKIKETAVAKLPQAREFAKRAVAGTAGAGASMMVGTIICKTADGPAMSFEQIAGYAAASGMISAYTSSAPLEGLVHGVAMGLLAQCVFSYAVSNEQQAGRQRLEAERRKWQQEEKELTLEVVECNPGVYRTENALDSLEPGCKFDSSKSLKLPINLYEDYLVAFKGRIVDCNKYRGSLFAKTYFCNSNGCTKGYEEVKKAGHLDWCEKQGYSYVKDTLQEQCEKIGFVNKTVLSFWDYLKS